MTVKTFTLGELKDELARLPELPDDTKIYFGAGDLSFYRLKQRGDTPSYLDFEFNELYKITHDPAAS